MVAGLLLALPAVNLGFSLSGSSADAFEDPQIYATPACAPESREAPGLRLIAWGCERPVIFYIPGLGAQASDRNYPTLERMFSGLVDSGFAVVVGDVGFNNWGNPASVEALHQLVLQFNAGQPPRLVGMSMSNAVIMNYGKKYPVYAAVGLVPVTRWTSELILRSGIQPPLPTSVSYPYHIWQGTEDNIVGTPRIKGAVVHPISGGHVIELDWPAADIADVLR
jgi:pimeloyl-ACP methyl ester carboxylesterase